MTSTPQDITTERPGDSIDFMALLRLLWRGKIWLVFCVLVFTLFGIYYAFRVAETLYRATAVVEMVPDEAGPLDLNSLVTGTSLETASLNTEIRKIQSRELAEEVTRQLDLIEDPEFNTALAPKDGFRLRSVIVELLNLAPEREERSAEEIAASQFRNTAARVQNAFEVIPEVETYLFRIQATSQSPRKASELATAMAEIYITQQLDEKTEDASRSLAWLNGRVTDLEAELRDRETVISELKADTDVISREAIAGLDIQIKGFREQLEQQQNTQTLNTRRLAEMMAARESGMKSAMLAVQDDFVLTRLGRNLGEDLSGPAETREAFLRQFDQMIASLELRISRAGAEISSLAVTLENLRQQFALQSADLQKIEQLERELTVTRNLYQTFLTGLQEATVQVGLLKPDARIMSSALAPRFPFAPRRSAIAALYMVLGLLFGAAVLLIREAFNTRIQSAQELASLTGKRVLGEITKVPGMGRNRRKTIRYLVENPTSPVAEAVRNLRTSILMTDNNTTSSQVIMVTSSLPGEGKTTLSIALAHNLSGLGKKVLIIEGDLRRRMLDQYFDTKASEKGLADLIEGDAELDQALLFDEKTNLFVLRGQKSERNAADLLSSARFEQFITDARDAFDYIVIDTPPVLIVPDSRIICRLCDKVIYAVRWNTASRSQVTEGLRLFSEIGQEITGVVLSQINARRAKYYGYNYYSAYGRNYYNQ
ncbi:GumC family protein [Roseobacteraceae bacterium S113]